VKMHSDNERCDWSVSSDVMREYHDIEWGVPVHDDQKLFEFLLLDAFQAGLSWEIVLRKRDAFRIAFRGFDPEAVAIMTDDDLNEVAHDASIIRNRAKIAAARHNARVFLEVAAEFGAFTTYFWSFVDERAISNTWAVSSEIPAETDRSRALSADMRRRGFKFAGPTIIYAVMQSSGLVNDHVASCFRHSELTQTRS
jgi:DNA-3-methyladenine glycosylase I